MLGLGFGCWGLGFGRNGEVFVRGYKLPAARWVRSGHLMYSMVNIINNTIIYPKVERVDLKCYHQKKVIIWGDGVISLIVVIILQYICIRSSYCLYTLNLTHYMSVSQAGKKIPALFLIGKADSVILYHGVLCNH